MDSYLAGAELCHPSDNIGAVLAASEHAGGLGKDFFTGRLRGRGSADSRRGLMVHGFDLTTQLTYSLAAGVSKALGLDEKRASWGAVEICGANGIPLLVVRTALISEWKGLVPSQLALGCVHGALLASRGVTGPAYVIEGADGARPYPWSIAPRHLAGGAIGWFRPARSRATTAPSLPNRPSSACSSFGRGTR
jgi:2-methylcitrate dehydratase